MANDELIRKQDALDALMAERKHLLAKGQKGAEHVLTHHGYNVIDELPPVQSDVPDIYAGELISRQQAIDAVLDRMDIEKHGRDAKPEEIRWTLEKLPPVQPKQEIIHCKDCKHWKLQIGNVKGDGLGSCDFHNVNLVTGEGFCYWADGRDEENE